MKGVSRRKFLIGTGWVAAGATVIYHIAQRATAVAPTFIFPDEQSGLAWIQLAPDGRCRFYFPRMDMGQNANTGLMQIIAEELNLELEAIEGIVANTSEVPPFALTAGSMSLTAFSRPVAVAAASLRELLRARAANHWAIPVRSVLDHPGGFRADPGFEVSYKALISREARPLTLESPNEAAHLYTFDQSREKRHVGHPAKPLFLREMVTGQPLYAADVRLDSMLYGRAVRPPVNNAEIESVSLGDLRSVPGFVQIVREENFIGVVCKTPRAVERAISMITVKWALKQPITPEEIARLVDVDDVLSKGSLEHQLLSNNPDREADWAVDLRFDVQIQSHAAQEPRAAIARFNNKEASHRLEIWTGTQDPFAMRRFASMHTGLNEDDIVIYPHRMGGGFGGREHYEVEQDAVRFAAAVGQPVKVQWARQDEFKAARNRPASTHRIRLGVDAEGDLKDWWHAYISGHVVLARDRLPGWLLPVSRLRDDFGVTKGGKPVYVSERSLVEYSDVDLPVDLGVWRSLNGAPAIFAIESAMDELAITLGFDSVDYRIAQMQDAQPRLKRCLERVREMSAATPLPQGLSVGRGFASGIYDGRCFVAVSADVLIDRENESIKVLRMCCAQDVGMAVNPDQLAAQIESNMAWSVGMALLEELKVGEDDILSSNFDNYPIARMSDMPVVESAIINQPSIPPAGAGEVALIAGPAAIANAIRRATGFRAVKLPIAYSDVIQQDSRDD